MASKPEPAPPEPVATTMRLDKSMLDALDAWAAHLTLHHPGPTWTRVDVIRATLARALRERGEKGYLP